MLAHGSNNALYNDQQDTAIQPLHCCTCNLQDQSVDNTVVLQAQLPDK